jgi:hypothetical protein
LILLVQGIKLIILFKIEFIYYSTKIFKPFDITGFEII